MREPTMLGFDNGTRERYFYAGRFRESVAFNGNVEDLNWEIILVNSMDITSLNLTNRSLVWRCLP